MRRPAAAVVGGGSAVGGWSVTASVASVVQRGVQAGDRGGVRVPRRTVRRAQSFAAGLVFVACDRVDPRPRRWRVGRCGRFPAVLETTRKPSAETAELERLRARNAKLEADLTKTRTALDIMGKAHALLEQLSESADDREPSASRKKR